MIFVEKIGIFIGNTIYAPGINIIYYVIILNFKFSGNFWTKSNFYGNLAI